MELEGILLHLLGRRRGRRGISWDGDGEGWIFKPTAEEAGVG